MEKLTFTNPEPYSIIAEGMNICTCYEFTEAVAVVFGCYYIFNIRFPNNLSRTPTLFGITDGTLPKDKK